MGEPARVVIQRRVEWPDTDAAGHWHYSTVVRWAEAAETVLFERLGLIEMYGMAPRVRFEVEFHTRLWFADVIDMDFRVRTVGRSSVTFDFEVSRGDDRAVTGTVIAVCVDSAAGKASPWPDRLRAAFLEGGEQRAERLT